MTTKRFDETILVRTCIRVRKKLVVH